jgi:hypothetical protein
LVVKAATLVDVAVMVACVVMAVGEARVVVSLVMAVGEARVVASLVMAVGEARVVARLVMAAVIWDSNSLAHHCTTWDTSTPNVQFAQVYLCQILLDGNQIPSNLYMNICPYLNSFVNR